MNIYKQLRKEKGLTQIELAEKFNIDQTTVSKWELNRAVPDISTLCKLSDFFDVSIDYLLGRSSYYYPDKIQEVPTAPMSGDLYSSEERKLVEVYRSLSDEMRDTLWSVLSTWAPNASITHGKKSVT